MHVVLIADKPYHGGAANSMVELAGVLCQQHQFDVDVCTCQYSELNAKLEDLGARTVVTGHSPFLYAPPIMKIRRPASILRAFFEWKLNMGRAILRAEKKIDFSTVDIIHSNLPRTDLGETISMKHAIPHICHLREFSFEDFGCLSFREKPGKFLTSHSEAFVAVSQAVADAWIKRGVEREKVNVIYDGIALPAVSPGILERTMGQNLSGVFLGGCNELKGIWDAVKAIEEIKEYTNVHLDVFGGGSRLTEMKVKRYIKAHGLDNNIAIRGFAKDTRSMLAKYDFAFVCSKAEAFGRVVVECQAARLLVIAANAGAIPELISDGVTGMIYEKEKGADALTKVFISAFSNREHVKSMIENAVSSSKKFGLSENADRILSLYNDVLKNRA